MKQILNSFKFFFFALLITTFTSNFSQVIASSNKLSQLSLKQGNNKHTHYVLQHYHGTLASKKVSESKSKKGKDTFQEEPQQEHPH